MRPRRQTVARPPLRNTLRRINPDPIVYVPSASGTLFSFQRARGQQYISRNAHAVLVLTQMQRHTAPVRRLLSRPTPDSVFCQSASIAGTLSRLASTPSFCPAASICRRSSRAHPRLSIDHYGVAALKLLTPSPLTFPALPSLWNV